MRPTKRWQHCRKSSVISSWLNRSYYHSYNVKIHFHNSDRHYIFCLHILQFTPTYSAFLLPLSCTVVNYFPTKEAVLHIRHHMKVRLPMCSSFTLEDRVCSTCSAQFALWVHSQSGEAIFSCIYMNMSITVPSFDTDCQCGHYYWSAVTDIRPAVDRHVTITVVNRAQDRRRMSVGGQTDLVTNRGLAPSTYEAHSFSLQPALCICCDDYIILQLLTF